MSVYFRIDDRLIHGQIVASWIASLNCNRIIVADDKAAVDTFQQALLKIAVPSSIKLQIVKVKEAADLLNELDENANVLVILKEVNSALSLVDNGFTPEMINVGNSGARKGATQYFKSLFFTDEDIEKYHKLALSGVKLITQVVPTEKLHDFFELIKK